MGFLWDVGRMSFQDIAFFIFSGVLIACALSVVAARNPVHSVLFLIGAFLNAAGLFVLLGAEFLALILVVVYVGAVAVLFLFVVMMLDVDFAQLRAGAVNFLPIGALIGLVLLAELVIMAFAWPVDPNRDVDVAQPIAPVEQVSNVEAIGRVLYTDYVYMFQAAGLILLVAMIGAIVLTLREREGVRRQNIAAQVARRKEDGVELRSVKSGEGI